MLKKMKSLVQAFVGGVEEERASILARELESRKRRADLERLLKEGKEAAKKRGVEIPEWLDE